MTKRLILSLFLLVVGVASATASILANSSHTSVKASNIHSIVATPIKGNTSYTLRVYEKEAGSAVMTVTRPLDGNIVDIAVRDIDGDDQDEIVVAMQEKHVEGRKVYFDVFEFKGNYLHWISDFSDLTELVAIFPTIRD